MSREETLKNEQTHHYLQYKGQELWFRTPLGSEYAQPLHQQGDAAYLRMELVLQLQR